MLTESQGWKEIAVPAAAGYGFAVSFLALLGVVLGIFGSSLRERVRRWKTNDISPGVPNEGRQAPTPPRPEPLPNAPDDNAFLAAVVAATPDLLYVYDLDSGATVFSNRGCAALLGFEEQPLHVSFLRDRLHDE